MKIRAYENLFTRLFAPAGDDGAAAGGGAAPGTPGAPDDDEAGDFGDNLNAGEVPVEPATPDDKDDPAEKPGDSDDAALRGAADEPAGDKPDEGKPTTTPKAGKGGAIPLDRHEKILAKERARREEAEAQLEQSRAGKEVVKANDAMAAIEDQLVEMERKYNDLLAEGDTAAAAAVMTNIRHKNAELTRVGSEQRDAVIMAQAVERVRYDEALNRIEEAYPALDPESSSFDEDLMQDVKDMMTAGMQRGLSATKSLQRAVARIMRPETTAQRDATTVTPRVDEKQVADERKGEAVKRNLDAAKRTPPATHRVGAGNDDAGGALTAKTVIAMDEADFEKLGSKDLDKLMGNTF